MKELEKKYNHLIAEEKWMNIWEKNQVYKWDESQAKENTFSIDTPPPTVSGSLHIGHVFSYTQTDAIARYQRMTGKNVFYPMGWDDNGLPTERRVQNVFGITCNPLIPFNPDWSPKLKIKDAPLEEVSRLNFIQACEQLTLEDEKIYEHTWKKLGLSIDWNQQYATINHHCRKLSQLSFLDLVAKNRAYKKYAVTLWDVDFKTAVAQAEIEDRIKPGMYHDITFKTDSGISFTISTTRPELLSGCIAVVAHPEDTRYRHLFGQYAITPLFHEKVPIMPSDHADPEKGTGILMVCTFGDIHDVEFWKKYQDTLPLRQVISTDGRLMNSGFLNGLKLNQARKKIVEHLDEQGLITDKKQIEHAVKFYEKGDSPVEFIPTYQWFIKLMPFKSEFLAQGDKIHWVPEFMKHRYKSWVEGINQDWCISRQRYFGVPFPVWYKIDVDGSVLYDDPIFPDQEDLPIDPMVNIPRGYQASQRNQPQGFTGDLDVMDTWATSSLTPQLTSYWNLNPQRHHRIFPMNLRPQSHEIIRTWAFYTIVKSWMHEQSIPWENIAISGWVLDPDRKKMSKSKGNIITPLGLIETYSADALRYWACKARLGSDTAYDENIFGIGQKLVTKIFNASKFAMIQIKESGFDHLTKTDIIHETDLAFSANLGLLIQKTTQAFDSFDYAAALDATEQLFWKFCDDYIELVKVRAYKDPEVSHRRSAIATLYIALGLFLRLFSPFLPFITEEVGATLLGDEFSIHKSQWPHVSELPDTLANSALFDWVSLMLSEIRAAKTQAQKAMKYPIKKAQITVQNQSMAQSLQPIFPDIINAGSIQELSVDVNSEIPLLTLQVQLASDIVA